MDRQFWKGLAIMILWALKNDRENDMFFNVMHDIHGAREGGAFFRPRSSRFQGWDFELKQPEDQKIMKPAIQIKAEDLHVVKRQKGKTSHKRVR